MFCKPPGQQPVGDEGVQLDPGGEPLGEPVKGGVGRRVVGPALRLRLFAGGGTRFRISERAGSFF